MPDSELNLTNRSFFFKEYLVTSDITSPGALKTIHIHCNYYTNLVYYYSVTILLSSSFLLSSRGKYTNFQVTFLGKIKVKIVHKICNHHKKREYVFSALYHIMCACIFTNFLKKCFRSEVSQKQAWLLYKFYFLGE